MIPRYSPGGTQATNEGSHIMESLHRTYLSLSPVSSNTRLGDRHQYLAQSKHTQMPESISGSHNHTQMPESISGSHDHTQMSESRLWRALTVA